MTGVTRFAAITLFSFAMAIAPSVAHAQSSHSSFSIRAAGIIGVEHFTAVETFNAIFGSANGTVYGGGADLRFGRHLFAHVDITHFAKTGERAFVNNGQVSRVGIPLDVSITPITASVGYRGSMSPTVVWYLGGGAGNWSYKQSGPDPADADSFSSLGYLGVGGMEWRLQKYFALGFEGQFASVPNAIGNAGVSQQLNEKDLGGFTGAIRLVIGRN